MVNKKIVAIIPARGGSKRIPRKNIIQLHGKPMIEWTIKAALNSKYISRTIVSTDDEEIAIISKKVGAEVPFLRRINADDHSPISLATLACLDQLRIHDNFKPDIIVQLMPNCPLRKSGDIDNAILHFVRNNINFQISCFKYGWMNPWWAHEINKKGIPKPIFKESVRMIRSQDQPQLFCPSGAIWIAKTKSLIKAKTFYGKDYIFYPISWVQAIDIDNYEDLKMAEYFMANK